MAQQAFGYSKDKLPSKLQKQLGDLLKLDSEPKQSGDHDLKKTKKEKRNKQEKDAATAKDKSDKRKSRKGDGDKKAKKPKGGVDID